MDNQQRQLNGWACLYGAIIAIAFLLFTSFAQGREWHDDIEIEYNESGSMIPDHEIEPMLEYAAWALTERAEKPTDYIGRTVSEGDKQSGKVTFLWASPDKMEEIGSSRLNLGYTKSWWWASDGAMAGAIVYLNRSLILEAGNCLQSTIVHELMHAAGYAGHSTDTHDVMYSNQSHCRYALSADDVQELPYGESTCWVELLPNGDLYIPMVDGHAASMKLTGEFSWELDQWDESSGDCSTVSVSGSTAVLSDVRGMDGEYYAELEATGTDEWALWYAE